jgi:hypothetical protein
MVFKKNAAFHPPPPTVPPVIVEGVHDVPPLVVKNGPALSDARYTKFVLEYAASVPPKKVLPAPNPDGELTADHDTPPFADV